MACQWRVLGPCYYSSLGVSDNSSLNEEFAALCKLCFEIGALFFSLGEPGTHSVAKAKRTRGNPCVRFSSCWDYVSP